MTQMIDGVVIERHKWFSSEGNKGDLMPEFFRGKGWDEFQVNLNTAFPRMVKGKHMHLLKEETFFCVKGNLLLHLEDSRDGSKTRGERQTVNFSESEGVSVMIPPGVWHSVENLGNQTGFFLELSNRFFNPQDEFRAPFDPAVDKQK